MKTKIFTIAAIICMIFTFAGEVQAMEVIGQNGADLQECGLRVRHRVIRRIVPRVVISPVVVIRNVRRYRHSSPPPPPPRRHWRYYR